MLNDSLIIMRKGITGNGLTNVTIGNETLTWFVDSRKLQANGIRSDVKFTEISIALALEVLKDGTYSPKLDHQYVFAFLPLRTYGLKFIIQGEFILPSSREEVDGDSPWNQWLLSELPDLFVSAERSFCSLPGFNNCQGKAVSDDHIEAMCVNCLLLEGENDKWVPPCRVLRNWNEQARTLLPDSLIHKHLGLGYLNKEIVLSDTLAWALALGIENYGPKVLVKILTCLLHTKEGLTSMGLNWLSSWLNELYSMSLQNSVDFKIGSDIMDTLAKTPFIPLLDGCYGAINEGMIWMNLDGAWNNLEAFARLGHIISEVYNKAFILTNHGFVIPSEVAVHFNNDFGNHIDIRRLISGIDIKWYEVDKSYLKYSSMRNWRKFLKEVGVTDFVQTVRVEKTVSSPLFLTNMMREKVMIPPGSTISDCDVVRNTIMKTEHVDSKNICVVLP
ncbi:hypothetical protein Hanom_Chr11g01000481 [Helianthus anomalus]